MLLGIDTSTRSVGIVLYDGHQILCEESWVSRRFHTVELAGAVDANLKRAGLAAKDLDVIGVAIGPGSFTGLRIGLALVKGLAYTHQLPVIGIPTLDITARAIPLDEDQRLAAVLQAGRDRLAVAWYEAGEGTWNAKGKLQNLSLKELVRKIKKPTILTGELTKEIRETLMDHELVTLAEPTLALRSPKYLAELAWERWQVGDLDDVLALKPTYLHKGDPIPG